MMILTFYYIFIILIIIFDAFLCKKGIVEMDQLCSKLTVNNPYTISGQIVSLSHETQMILILCFAFRY